MLWLTIAGAKPYDGRYEFDLQAGEFTTREWGMIKRHSGYLPLTIQDGFEGGDPELFAVFAVIALYRAQRIEPRDVADVFEKLLDAPFGTTIRLEDDSEEPAEADAGPPASSSNGSSSSSGDASNESSVSSDATPSAAGTDDSATSELPPPRLVT